MATEEQKKANQMRLVGLTVRGTALGIWDMIGETASSLGPSIGQQTLEMMEKEMGLEIAGEKPEDVLNEIARLFVDEFSFCSSIDLEAESDVITMKVSDCLMATLTGKLIDDGVDPFICPYRNTGAAALKRLGMRVRTRVDFDGKRSVITFELL
jgi:hypothetical protein